MITIEMMLGAERLQVCVNRFRYSVPSQEEAKFKSVMKDLIPTLVSNSPRWLKEDTAMVSEMMREGAMFFLICTLLVFLLV